MSFHNTQTQSMNTHRAVKVARRRFNRRLDAAGFLYAHTTFAECGASINPSLIAGHQPFSVLPETGFGGIVAQSAAGRAPDFPQRTQNRLYKIRTY